MSLVTIGKRFTFDAAHRLGRHEGKCRRPHGHTYILEIDVTGNVKFGPVSAQGMVVDYYIMKEIVTRAILDRVDHQDLNQVLGQHISSLNHDPEIDNVTTAENMVRLFATWLTPEFAKHQVIVTRIRLQETQSSWAEWTPALDNDSAFLHAELSKLHNGQRPDLPARAD